jgi:TRAP-type transport system periplasmic protein
MNKRNFIASISLAMASVFVVAPAAAQDVKARMGHVFATNSGSVHYWIPLANSSE